MLECWFENCPTIIVLWDITVGQIDPLIAKLFYLYFQALEAVSRYSDTQLQVDENYSYFFNLSRNICKSCFVSAHFVPNNSDLIGY